MRYFIVTLTLLLAHCSFGQSSNQKNTFSDQLTPVDIAAVKVDGEIGRRIDITIANNLLKLDIDKDFLESFIRKNDGGYIGLGKLTDGVIRMSYYNRDPKVTELKNHLINVIISSQEPDGYIGNMSVPNRMWKLWDIHEMGYIIYSLSTDYSLFNSKSSLEAAEKAAVYIISKWPSMPAGWGKNTDVVTHVAITGLHRTMLNLYNLTDKREYLDFCINELKLKELDPGIIIGRRKLIEGHIYGYMAASLAQLEYYRTEQDERLLKPASDAMAFLTSGNGMAISGGAGQEEIWTNDQDCRGDLGETCATAYQLRVYDSFLRLYGDSRYGDIMERTIYNALFGAQSPDGRQIRYFTPPEGERVYHNGDTYCCPCNFRRIISELPAMVFYKDENGIAINLYSQSTAAIPLNKNLVVNIIQETDYPNSGKINIKVNPSVAAEFKIKLRIPSWCNSAVLTVNGKSSGITCVPGTFAEVIRTWKKGDQVSLDLPMDWRLIRGREKQAGRVAVMRGPVLYSLDPSQSQFIAGKDGADLGRIVIERETIEQDPVNNKAVRPEGSACVVTAGNIPMALGNSKNLRLILTEFADPAAKCTYFRIPDLAAAKDDELIGLWK